MQFEILFFGPTNNTLKSQGEMFVNQLKIIFLTPMNKAHQFTLMQN